MNNLTRTLGIVFVIQCVLVFLLNVGLGSSSNVVVEKPLLSFDLNSVESVKIEDPNESVTFQKVDGKLVIPTLENFPVSDSKWNEVKKKLAEIKRGWPVATSQIAAKQLKLTEEEFERKLTFKTPEGEQILYFGTSPGFKKVHAKVKGEDDSFSVDFSTFETSVKDQDWTEKEYLYFSRDTTSRIIHPNLTLEKGKEGFAPAEIPADRALDEKKVDSIVKLYSSLPFLEVLGTEDKKDYHLENESSHFEVEMNDGKKFRYDVSLHKEGSYAVLKPSHSPYFFKVTKLNYEKIRDLKLEELLKDKKEDAAEESSQSEVPAEVSEEAE